MIFLFYKFSHNHSILAFEQSALKTDVSLTSQMLAALQRAISIGVADLEREKEQRGQREKNVSLDVAERAVLVATNLCLEHSCRARFASSAEFLSALLDFLEIERIARLRVLQCQFNSFTQ